MLGRSNVIYCLGVVLIIYPIFMVLAEVFKLGRFISWHPQPSILYSGMITAMFVFSMFRRWDRQN